MARYQPYVTIAGGRIDCDWAGRPVVLSGIEIDWGRASILDRVDPSKARVTIIDPVGDWASDPSLYGADLVIRLDDTNAGRVWRGTVDEITLAPTDIDGELAWEAVFYAVDPLAELSKRNPPGVPFTGTFRYLPLVQFGAGYWTETTPAWRIYDLFPNAADILSGIEYPDLGSTPAKLGHRERTDSTNLYQLVLEAYAAQPLAWATYQPANGRIRVGAPTAPGALGLVYAGDVISIVSPGGSVIIIDGCAVERDGDGDVTLSLEDNIGGVEISRRQYQTNSFYKLTVPRDDDPNLTTELTTTTFKDSVVSTAPVTGPATNPSNVYAIDSTFKDDTSAYDGPWVNAYATTVATALGKLNGRTSPPPMTFDLEETDYGAAVEAALLAPVDTTVPVYIAGTEYTVLRTWGPQFQMIGAHLEFDRGWRITPVFAAIGGTAGNPVSYATWVTNTVAEYRDFDAAIAYSDLANVSTGAA